MRALHTKFISITEERKKSDEEFEAKRLQRLALQRSGNAGGKDKPLPKPALVVSHEVKPVAITTVKSVPHPIVRSPPVTSRTVPIFESAESSTKAIQKTIAKIQAVKPLGEIILEQSAGTRDSNSSAPKPVVFETPSPSPGSLAFLRNDSGFIQIRDAIQRNHELLLPFIKKIQHENPQLALLLSQNENEFRFLLAETSKPVFPKLSEHVEFLAFDLRLLKLRPNIQRRPHRLGWAMRKLVEEHPNLAAMVACNEAWFIQWLNNGSAVRIGPVGGVGSTLTQSPALVNDEMAVDSGNLDFLRANHEFLTIRATYQARPEMLKWLAGKFVAKYPDLKTILVNNEAEFTQLMNEGFVPPAGINSQEEYNELDDEQSQSPLSQRIRQAEQNRILNTTHHLEPKLWLTDDGAFGPQLEKKVRFSDSVIRRDNSMEFSPLGNDQAAQENTEHFHTAKPVKFQGFVDTQNAEDWTAYRSRSRSPSPDSPDRSFPSTSASFNGSTVSHNQPVPALVQISPIPTQAR